jgi:hypothetical protein
VSKALDLNDAPFLKAFDGVKKLTLLLSLKFEVLKHIAYWRVHPAESANLVPEIVHDQTLNSSALPSCVA